MRQYRFFYHFNRANKAMTVHYRGRCIPAQNVRCNVPCETKWSSTQPMLVMRGYASIVEVRDNIAYIE